ncbi:uncharacterized protein RJT20DRAFT_123825 [Scheffersomyces xylosifermentans]|uniref:uncharacterized protein n=1 Tax=Scheffersomyces xylosifermentans TaxID=1304137 RepID=UPI00315DF6FE
MALRNYMYAKHINDSITKARINKVEPSNPDNSEIEASMNSFHHRNDKTRTANRHKRRHVTKQVSPIASNQQVSSTGEECNSGRELILEDGTKMCRNCSDCVKKQPVDAQTPRTINQLPRLTVEVQDSQAEVPSTASSILELEQRTEELHLGSQNPTEIDFTNSF